MSMELASVSVPVTTLWTSPGKVRNIDKPAIVDRPDPRAWPDSLDKEARLDLLGRVDSQLLLGEPVQVIAEDGDWVQVVALWQPSSKDPRGYPGWIPRAHLAERAEWTGREAAVTVDTTPLEIEDGDGSDPALEATYGTILPVEDSSDGMLLVRLPGSAKAWISRAACDVRGTRDDRAAVAVNPEFALSAARRFIGVQYLWSGTSAYGLDCSGIVHLVYRTLGRQIPRDAHDQALVGRRLPRGQAQPGDLHFFQKGKGIDHVGFVSAGEGCLLHAPGTGNGVVDEPMPEPRQKTVLDFVTRLTG